jgi:hypothetical protein
MEVMSRDERMEVRMLVFIQMSSNTGWRRAAIMRAFVLRQQDIESCCY